MIKSEGRALAALLIAVVLVMGGAAFLKGGFYIAKHEGDTLHMAEIILRMADGEWPHLDFMTPIGIMAAAPVALFVKAGLGIGHAIFAAQVLVALLLLPATLFVAETRMRQQAGKWPTWLYAAFVMIMCLALVHGEANTSNSISMHYNRWAWAVAFLIVPLIMIDRTGPARPWAEGAVLGLGLAALALTKMTYFAALAPVVAIALLARRWWSVLATTAVWGLVVAAALTLMAGPEFFLAYAQDNLTVAQSAFRSRPGAPIWEVAAGPATLAASGALFGGIIFLRQGGRMVEGMLLLFLAPAFIYITYQNYGNDPQWLPILALVLWAVRPAIGTVNGWGWDLHKLTGLAAFVALISGLPSVLNLTYSPLHHLAEDTHKRRPLLSYLPQHRDILSEQKRLYSVTETSGRDGLGQPFARYRAFGEQQHLAYLNGELLPHCEMQSGLSAWFEWVARDLQDGGYTGAKIFTADLFGQFWMYGPFERLPGGAPWYYGGLPGIDEAQYVLIPLCPNAAQVRAAVLETLSDSDFELTEVRRNAVYILVSIKKSS